MQTRRHKKSTAAAVTKKLAPCSVCGKKIRVHSDGKIIGGYYFGKIPMHRKSELERMKPSGTHKAKIGRIEIEVFNYDPKPYKHIEYWECLACYRGQHTPLRNVDELHKQARQKRVRMPI